MNRPRTVEVDELMTMPRNNPDRRPLTGEGPESPRADRPSTHSSAPTPAAAPDVILDVDGAVRRLLNDRALYLTLLEQFDGMMPSDLSQIEAVVAASSMAEARRLVHSMCGAARMLGAERLAAVTAQTFRSLSESDPHAIAREMSGLRACVTATRAAIAQARQGQQP